MGNSQRQRERKNTSLGVKCPYEALIKSAEDFNFPPSQRQRTESDKRYMRGGALGDGATETSHSTGCGERNELQRSSLAPLVGGDTCGAT